MRTKKRIPQTLHRVRAPGRSITAARRAAIVLAAALVAACGGGGGGSDPAAVSPPVPPPPPPPPPPAGPNHAPVAVKTIPDQRTGGGRFFNLDVSQGDTTFADSDGDTLTYSMAGAPWPLDVKGTSFAGIAPAEGTFNVSIYANDGRGGQAEAKFKLELVPNGAPVLASPNYAVLVKAATQVLYDSTKGRTTFTDPEGDALAYELKLISAPRGLDASAEFVVGTLAGPSVSMFELKATDPFGATAVDRFSVAAAAPEPSPPVLPNHTYVYADAELDLPASFAAAVSIPRSRFWDTTDVNPITNAGATLGRVLFYDKRLSVTNTHACGSCHMQTRGFGSSQQFEQGVLGVLLKRHGMALANSRFNVDEHWFSDLRATPIEALVLMPIEEPTELGSYLPQVETKLVATSFYPALFQAAFGTPEVTRERIALALGQFVRSLMSYRSKFDTVYTDDVILENLLTAEERHGRELFDSSAAKCHFCHMDRIQTTIGARNNGLDGAITDPGVITLEGATGRFRAPSLRNIAVSAPYMHDGRFATLREVIDHYDHGVQESRTLDNTLRENMNFFEPPQRLNLTEQDKQALEAFLRTLTDDAFLTDPKFANPFP